MQDFDDEPEESSGIVNANRPPRRFVTFRLEHYCEDDIAWEAGEDDARHLAEMNRMSAMDRAAVLFGSEAINDPLIHYKVNPSSIFSFEREPPATFKLVPSQFIRRAQMMPPERPQATASAFSQWIYSLYGNAYGNEEDRERGKAMEKKVLDLRRQSACSIDNRFLRSIRSDWTLAHNGMHLNDTDKVNYLEISHLRVNGEPLRASPDLLYHNARHSEVIIVEIKYSRLPITTNLWPNLWAQLWCYSQLEIAQSAKNLTVVGEVWGERKRKRKEEPQISLRASVRRDPRALAYDRFFRKLFDIYCGKP